jgi:hypothetical protein
MKLPDGPLPTVNSNRQGILLNDRPQFDAHIAHAYADSDWATLTGPHASKYVILLVVLAFNSLGVQSFTNVSLSQQSSDHQQKQNLWPPMTKEK